MSSEPIQAGDLVAVVHVHCEAAVHLYGRMFTVEAVRMSVNGRCPYCGELVGAHEASVSHKARSLYPLAWLVKIKPLPPEEVAAEKRQISAVT